MNSFYHRRSTMWQQPAPNMARAMELKKHSKGHIIGKLMAHEDVTKKLTKRHNYYFELVKSLQSESTRWAIVVLILSLALHLTSLQ